MLKALEHSRGCSTRSWRVRVVIMGNKRTPDKFVGKEAVVTSQCLNGWYLVKAVDSGESIRLQYRSLRKVEELQVQALLQSRQ